MAGRRPENAVRRAKFPLDTVRLKRSARLADHAAPPALPIVAINMVIEENITET